MLIKGRCHYYMKAFNLIFNFNLVRFSVRLSKPLLWYNVLQMLLTVLTNKV